MYPCELGSARSEVSKRPQRATKRPAAGWERERREAGGGGRPWEGGPAKSTAGRERGAGRGGEAGGGGRGGPGRCWGPPASGEECWSAASSQPRPCAGPSLLGKRTTNARTTCRSPRSLDGARRSAFSVKPSAGGPSAAPPLPGIPRPSRHAIRDAHRVCHTRARLGLRRLPQIRSDR